LRTKKKCSKAMRYFKRTVFCTLLLFLALIIFFELTVRDRLELAIIAEIKTVSHTAINNAVEDYLNTNSGICENLMHIDVADNKQITSIREDMYNVNSLKTQVKNISQQYIDDMMRVDGIDVKLGNFSGLTILSDLGPYIHFNIESTPTVSCEILSSFESAGVNQTLHHITLEVYVDIYVGNPIRIESVSFKTKYEISQTVLVGVVPSTYGMISRY